MNTPEATGEQSVSAEVSPFDDIINQLILKGPEKVRSRAMPAIYNYASDAANADRKGALLLAAADYLIVHTTEIDSPEKWPLKLCNAAYGTLQKPDYAAAADIFVKLYPKFPAELKKCIRWFSNADAGIIAKVASVVSGGKTSVDALTAGVTARASEVLAAPESLEGAV